MPENTYVKLEHFTSAITADALDESKKIYDEIKRESDKALSAADDVALDEMFRFVKNEATRIRTEAGRRISRKMMENKRLLALRRSEMSAECVESVRLRLADYVRTPAYREKLKTLVAGALDIFKDDAIFTLRETDMPLIPEITPDNCPYKLEFRAGHFELGGLLASCHNRRLQIDETFDTTLAEIGNRFAELAGLEVGEKK